MPFFLSWKAKFRLLAIVTLMGLALITAFSLWTNQQLGLSLQARQKASDYGNASTELLNHWLRLEVLRGGLSTVTADAFARRLAAVEPLCVKLKAAAAELADPDITTSASRIGELMQANVTLQRRWLQQRQQLGLSDAEGQRKAVAKSSAPLSAITIGLIQPSIAEAVNNQRDYLNSLDPDYAVRARSSLARLTAQIADLDWKDSPIGQDVARFARVFGQTDALIGSILASQAELSEQAKQIEAQMDAQNSQLRDGILTHTAARAQQAQRSSYWILGLAFCIVAGVLLIALTQASRVLMTQLGRVIEQLSRVAAGDLSGKLPIGRNPKDEFNRLGDASNRMSRDIAGLIHQVIEGNRELVQLHRHLDEAMRRLDANSSQVEVQTEQAASASQQTAVTLNDMAQRAAQVNDATASANEAARLGAVVIVASVDSIRRLSQLIQSTHQQVQQLNRSSERVSGIVSVINGLAGQTNLLALNAAIEAARAGEAGRGFAVVADEVRSLARKTVSATSDIGGIIDDLKQQTQKMDELMISGIAVSAEGERQASQAVDAVESITTSMDQLSAQMNQVAVAIEETSATTEEIATKIEDIHRHTGETRDLRLSMERHADELARQAQVLSESTGQFRIQ